MKKLLYIIPLILLFLNFLPVAFLGTNISYIASTIGKPSFSPPVWHQLSLKAISVKHNPYDSYGFFGDSPDAPAQKLNNSSFTGFPMAYYAAGNVSSVYQVPERVAAFAWPWALLDGLLILITLVAALVLNHKIREKPLTGKIPSPTEKVVGN